MPVPAVGCRRVTGSGARRIAAWGVGARDEVAQRLERSGHEARCPRLHEHVAERRRLDGAGEHGEPRPVGGALAEQLVEGAAADDVDRPRRRPGRRARPATAAMANASASDSMMLRANSARVRGAATPCSAHQSSMRRGMSPGARKRGSFASKTGTGAGDAPRRHRAGSAGRSDAPRAPRCAPTSLSTQSPMTLCRNRTRPSTPPSFVKFAARRLGAEDEVLDLDADEPPRAAGDVGRGIRLASARRRPRTPCRASRPR